MPEESSNPSGGETDTAPGAPPDEAESPGGDQPAVATTEGEPTEASAAGAEGVDDELPEAATAPSPIEPVPPESDVVEPEETSPAVEEESSYEDEYEPTPPSLRPADDFQMPKKPPYDGPFRGGRIRLGLSVGGGTYGDETYFIPGFGVGYFLVNGLEVHVDTDFWLIGDPFMATPSPGLRYVFWMVPSVHPYVGGFYRRYFVGSGIEDANSVGARGGVYFMTGRRSYFGLGVAYERMLDDHLFQSDEFIFPEVAFVFAF